jgi:prepilin-type N-terminal cleavage/methylation domain-containing protein
LRPRKITAIFSELKPLKPMKADSKTRFPRRGRGFTLVEMLIVIVIMSVLMTAGAIGLSGMGGKGVSSGAATVESLFDEARSTAIGNRTRARVLIADELTNSPADNLRRIVVITEDLDASTGLPKSPESWSLSSRASVLPDQVYFSEKLSKKDHTGGGTIEKMTLSGSTIKPAYLGKYYYYEFNAEGVCSTPGASFVIGTGARGLGSAGLTSSPKVTAAAKRDFGGFVVWRNGSTSAFRSPDQISSSLPGTGNEF